MTIAVDWDVKPKKQKQKQKQHASLVCPLPIKKTWADPEGGVGAGGPDPHGKSQVAICCLRIFLQCFTAKNQTV